MKTQLIKTINVEKNRKLSSIDCALWLKLQSGSDTPATLLMILTIGGKKIKLNIDKNTLTSNGSVMLNNQMFLSEYAKIELIEIYLNSDNQDIRVDTMHILENYKARKRVRKPINLELAA